MSMAQHKDFAKGFQDCPVLGVGFGLRRPLLEETLAAKGLINWMEIIPENHMGKGGSSWDNLERSAELYPIVTHGVTMSLGSVDPWDEAYLTELKKLFTVIDAPWFSDHLCYGGIHGAYFNDLIPIPRTQEAVDHTIKRIKFIKETFERPYLIENISFYLEYTQNQMPDHEFMTRIAEGSDCGLLLDVNNIYVNSLNHHFDPVEDFLKHIPLERVVQIHVAGHTEFPDGIVDTHGEAVCDGVWDLLEWVMKRCNPCGVLLERDQNYPSFTEIKAELTRIQSIWNATQPLKLGLREEEARCA